jgi:hypothetical protein
MSDNRVNSFSNYLFWDVDKNEIDLDANKSYVIERVLSHGMLTDWKLLKEIYGLGMIKEVVLNLRHMDKFSLNFCSIYFDVPINEFRCYKLAQLNPAHWNY